MPNRSAILKGNICSFPDRRVSPSPVLVKFALHPFVVLETCPFSVEGIGGVGKTRLALEATYRCLRTKGTTSEPLATPSFDAIIFTSAKRKHFTPSGVLKRFNREHTLGHILAAVARTLDRPALLAGELDDQIENVLSSLGRQQTLLIVDNLETLEEQDDLLSFLYDLPSTVKTIVTSRDRIPLDVSIQLDPQVTDGSGSVSSTSS